MKVNRIKPVILATGILLTSCGKEVKPSQLDNSLNNLTREVSNTIDLGFKSIDKALNDDKFIPAMITKLAEGFKWVNNNLEKFVSSNNK